MVNHLILDKGGVNQIDFLHTKVDETAAKTLNPITTPISSANWANGANTTKLVDLLRLVNRFTVNGILDSANRTKFKNIIRAGGTSVMEYDAVDYNINIERYTITEVPEDKINDLPLFFIVTFTCIEGEDF